MGNKKGTDFTKRFPPADPKDLPKEERDLLERQKRMDENKPQEGEELKTNLSKEDQDLINATGESNIPSVTAGSGGSRARKSDIPATQFAISGGQFFADRAAESMAYWAKYDHYEIEMTDGSYLKVYRVRAPKFALEAMKNLNAEILSGLDINTNMPLNQMQIRKKEIEFDEMKWATYMRYQDGDHANEPVKREDVMDAADSTVPDGIVEACVAISISKWTEAKK
jgi:hypothetical protein